MKCIRPAVLVLLTILGISFSTALLHTVEESVALNKPIRVFGLVYPRLSPDDKTIVFSWQGALWRIERTGGVMMQLTAGSSYDMEPAWPADGKQIAYINSTSCFSDPLRIIDARTGTAVQIAKGSDSEWQTLFSSRWVATVGQLYAERQNKRSGLVQSKDRRAKLTADAGPGGSPRWFADWLCRLTEPASSTPRR